MIDFVVVALRDIGLTLNARKTKVLIVPSLGTKEDEYLKLKNSITSNGGFQTAGREISLVDDFMYLGICICWKWDWSMAWHSAQKRARSMMYLIRQTGFQNQGTPLVYQLRYACSQVLCHLDYVAALAGVEGHSTFISENERIVSDMLRVVACLPPKFSGDALKIESGTWSQVARIRMLQLRFFAKITKIDIGSTHFRALCLSRQGSEPSRKSGKSCIWNWFDKAIRSASLFVADGSVLPNTADFGAVSSALRPCVALAQLEYFDTSPAHFSWLPVTPDNLHAIGVASLRWVSTSTQAFGMDYTLGRQMFSWQLPPGTSAAEACRTWTPQLQDAVFASLRRRGNKFRHDNSLPKTFAYWSTPDSAFRDLAAIKPASYLEPYWYAPDPRAGRRFLRARVGAWGDEYGFRRAPHSLPRVHEETLALLKQQQVPPNLFEHGRLLPRIQPECRACYLCPCDIWLPESMAHLLLDCPHASMVKLRAEVKCSLSTLFARAASIHDSPQPLPDLEDPVALYSILMLCTAIGSLDHVPAANANPHYHLNVLVPIGVQTRATLARNRALLDLAERRRNHRFALSAARMRHAVEWVAFFTQRWSRAIAMENTQDPSSKIGESLVSLVCDHSQRLYSARRMALRSSVGFAIRDRDPVAQPEPAQ